jgi:hypothetical protein
MRAMQISSEHPLLLRIVDDLAEMAGRSKHFPARGF